MAASPFNESSALSRTDRKLFSLYTTYPELNYDPEDCKAGTVSKSPSQTACFESSPSSDHQGHDETDTSHQSNSTAHTTPIRPALVHGEARDQNEGFNDYLRHVQESDLPQECIVYFSWLGRSITDLGRHLFGIGHTLTPDGNRRRVDMLTKSIFDHIVYSTEQVDGQIRRLLHMISLGIFTCTPSEPYLWSVYRQRAQIVIR